MTKRVDDDRLHEGQADEQHDLDPAAGSRIAGQPGAGLAGRTTLADGAAGRGDADSEGGPKGGEITGSAAPFTVLRQRRSSEQGEEHGHEKDQLR